MDSKSMTHFSNDVAWSDVLCIFSNAVWKYEGFVSVFSNAVFSNAVFSKRRFLQTLRWYERSYAYRWRGGHFPQHSQSITHFIIVVSSFTCIINHPRRKYLAPVRIAFHGSTGSAPHMRLCARSKSQCSRIFAHPASHNRRNLQILLMIDLDTYCVNLC